MLILKIVLRYYKNKVHKTTILQQHFLLILIILILKLSVACAQLTSYIAPVIFKKKKNRIIFVIPLIFESL